MKKSMEKRGRLMLGLLGLLVVCVSALSLGRRAEATEDRRNAALVYWRAFALMKEPADKTLGTKVGDIAYGKRPFDESDEALQALINDNRTALQLAREGALLDVCDFQLDHSKGFDMQLPHLSKARSLMRLLLLEGKRFEHLGRWSEAVDNYLAAIRLGTHVATDRTIISSLVSVATIRASASALKDCVARMPSDESALHMIAEALSALPRDTGNWENALRGEEELFDVLVTQLDNLVGVLSRRSVEMKAREQNGKTLADVTSEILNQARKDDAAGYEKEYIDYITLMIGAQMGAVSEEELRDYVPGRLGSDDIRKVAERLIVDDDLLREFRRLPELLERSRAESRSYYDRWIEIIEKPYAKSREMHKALEAGIPEMHLVARLFLPALSKLHKQKAELERLLAITRLATSLAAYKAQNGNYPAQLSDLPGLQPTDPYSGGTFVYERTESGYRLFSAPADGEDRLLLHEVPPS